jgi:hypothetical protein
MSSEIADDDIDEFSDDDFDPAVAPPPLDIKEQHTDARRRIEELMERRRLKDLLEDPYKDMFDEDL